MNKKLLCLPLLLLAVMVTAELKQSAVLAMIIYGTDGSRQVVQLDATDVTDLIVLQNGQSLSVDIPEAKISSVRSITLAMVATEEITTAVESAENPIVHSVEKVMHDGHVFIRLQMRNGSIVEYNIQGNQITTK